MSLESPQRFPHDSSRREGPAGSFESLLKKRELIDNAYGKARTIINRESIDPSDFGEVYPASQIEDDLKRAAVFEGRFDTEARGRAEGHELVDRMATVAEALVYQEIGVGGWFSVPGMKVFVEKTSRPDDIFNKVDIVLTFVGDDTEEPFALSIDVTMGARTLQEKIHGIKQQLDTKRLSQVKYHETPDGERRSLDDVPRAVLAIDPAELIKLMSLWVSDERAQKDRLHAHPVQHLFVEEIAMQLASFTEYAKRTDAPARIIDKLQTASDIFTMIKTMKREEGTELTEPYREALSMLQGSLRHLTVAADVFSKNKAA